MQMSTQSSDMERMFVSNLQRFFDIELQLFECDRSGRFLEYGVDSKMRVLVQRNDCLVIICAHSLQLVSCIFTAHCGLRVTSDTQFF